MNFSELLLIIEHLKKKLKCPKCRTFYKNRDIFILGTAQNEALFHLRCPACQGHILATVVIGHNKDTAPTFTISSPEKTVSQNDILDMHNFLKKFNGDFSQHFKPKI